MKRSDAEQVIFYQHLAIRLCLGAIALWLAWQQPLGRAIVGIAILLPLYLGSEAVMHSRIGWLHAAEAQRARRERDAERARLAEERRRAAAEKYFDVPEE